MTFLTIWMCMIEWSVKHKKMLGHYSNEHYKIKQRFLSGIKTASYSVVLKDYLICMQKCRNLHYKTASSSKRAARAGKICLACAFDMVSPSVLLSVCSSCMINLEGVRIRGRVHNPPYLLMQVPRLEWRSKWTGNCSTGLDKNPSDIWIGILPNSFLNEFWMFTVL